MNVQQSAEVLCYTTVCPMSTLVNYVLDEAKNTETMELRELTPALFKKEKSLEKSN